MKLKLLNWDGICRVFIGCPHEDLTMIKLQWIVTIIKRHWMPLIILLIVLIIGVLQMTSLREYRLDEFPETIRGRLAPNAPMQAPPEADTPQKP